MMMKKSIIKDDDLSFDDESLKEDDLKDKSLKDELKSNIGKTIIKILTRQGLNFNKIKIDENLLKKKYFKSQIY